MKRMVQIVGAGPGDPELISIKGVKALQRADVILYDGPRGNRNREGCG